MSETERKWGDWKGALVVYGVLLAFIVFCLVMHWVLA